jgi:hypothetical protein
MNYKELVSVGKGLCTRNYLSNTHNVAKCPLKIYDYTAYIREIGVDVPEIDV